MVETKPRCMIRSVEISIKSIFSTCRCCGLDIQTISHHVDDHIVTVLFDGFSCCFNPRIPGSSLSSRFPTRTRHVTGSWSSAGSTPTGRTARTRAAAARSARRWSARRRTKASSTTATVRRRRGPKTCCAPATRTPVRPGSVVSALHSCMCCFG